MKKIIVTCLMIMHSILGNGQVVKENTPLLKPFKFVKIPSRIPTLNLSIRCLTGQSPSSNPPVLFVHGASFPSGLAFGFRMEGYSWMDYLADHGYDVYALDFLGYGNSDRYPEMLRDVKTINALGHGREVVADINLAIKYILKKSDHNKLHLIGHSWGATVSGYFASVYPGVIEKLVLFAPFVQRKGPTEWKTPDYAYIDLTPKERIEQFISGIPAGESMTLEKDVLSKWGNDWLQSDRLAVTREANAIRYPSGWRRDLFDCWNMHCLFNPQNVLAPTLVIRGEWDGVLNDEDANWLFSELKNANSKKYVVLEKSTHVAHLEKQRNQLYQEVNFFLKNK